MEGLQGLRAELQAPRLPSPSDDEARLVAALTELQHLIFPRLQAEGRVLAGQQVTEVKDSDSDADATDLFALDEAVSGGAGQAAGQGGVGGDGPRPPIAAPLAASERAGGTWRELERQGIIALVAKLKKHSSVAVAAQAAAFVAHVFRMSPAAAAWAKKGGRRKKAAERRKLKTKIREKMEQSPNNGPGSSTSFKNYKSGPCGGRGGAGGAVPETLRAYECMLALVLDSSTPRLLFSTQVPFPICARVPSTFSAFFACFLQGQKELSQHRREGGERAGNRKGRVQCLACPMTSSKRFARGRGLRMHLNQVHFDQLSAAQMARVLRDSELVQGKPEEVGDEQHAHEAARDARQAGSGAVKQADKGEASSGRRGGKRRGEVPEGLRAAMEGDLATLKRCVGEGWPLQTTDALGSLPTPPLSLAAFPFFLMQGLQHLFQAPTASTGQLARATCTCCSGCYSSASATQHPPSLRAGRTARRPCTGRPETVPTRGISPASPLTPLRTPITPCSPVSSLSSFTPLPRPLPLPPSSLQATSRAWCCCCSSRVWCRTAGPRTARSPSTWPASAATCRPCSCCWHKAPGCARAMTGGAVWRCLRPWGEACPSHSGCGLRAFASTRHRKRATSRCTRRWSRNTCRW